MKNLRFPFSAILILLFAFQASGQNIYTVCGNGYTHYWGNGVVATAAELNGPWDVVTDAAGNVYFTDQLNNMVRKVSASGIITTIAGTGYNGYSGDGGPATNAMLSAPAGIAIDYAGNIIFSEYGSSVIRKINTSGVISTIAGNGVYGYAGDGGQATAANLANPSGIVLDNTGNLYIADAMNNCIRKVSATGIITTVVGNYTLSLSAFYNGDGINATDATLGYPTGVTVDASGNIFIADQWNYRVRKVDVSGIIHTVMADSTLSGLYPANVCTDANGGIFVVDNGTQNVYRLDSTGIITTIAGNNMSGFSGDGGAATSAELNTPFGVRLASTGQLYIGDYRNNRIRMVNTSGIINTFAGGSEIGLGDGGSGMAAELNFPVWVTKDTLGNMYVAEIGDNRIRKIGNSGVITTFAGNGNPGFSGDGGPATAAKLYNPYCVLVDRNNNVLVADYVNDVIRKIDPAGVITTIAGMPDSIGYSGDGGPATAAKFLYPISMALDKWGNLYVSDRNNNRVRKIDTFGIITTFAGTGVSGFSGDGAAATAAKISRPHGIAIDDTGNLYFCDTYNYRIRKINTAGIITTIAGNGTYGNTGDGGPATSAELSFPAGISVDAIGNIVVSDASSYSIRIINVAGNISTVVGTGVSGFSGDGGPATAAQLNGPYGNFLDKAGNLYIADANNNRIRKVIYNLLVSPEPSPIGKLHVQPNPTNGNISVTLNSPSTEPMRVFVCNLLGAPVQEFSTTTNSTREIELGLPNGIYFLSVTTQTGKWTEKIVVIGK